MNQVLTNPIINTIQQASAGTGKTFALSNRYLSLLARGIECDEILAITFTRKGAGEILDRIIQRLARAAQNDQLAAGLGLFLGISLNQSSARTLLRQLATKLHRLQIGTIDSYFYRVAQSFTAELGLPFDWQIAEEAQLLETRYQAIEQMLADDQVVSLLHLISNADAGRRVGDVIHQTVAAIYQIFRESTPAAWRRLGHSRRPTDDRIQAFVERGRSLAGKGRQFKKWNELLDVLAADDWDRLQFDSLLLRARHNEFKFYGDLDVALIPLVRELAQLVAEYFCWELDCRNAAALALVNSYSQAYFPRLQAAGNLRFDDVTWLLSKLAVEHRASFVARLDQAAAHLLLDEFQDTSPEQWRVIEPIAEQVTRPQPQAAIPGTFFCVGDKKQAIYGWRGGVAEIFDVVESALGERLVASAPLVESYRSAPVVIAAVNRVFQNLQRAASRDTVDEKVLQKWQANFPVHRTAKQEYPGCVQLIQAQEDTPESGEAENAAAPSVNAVLRVALDQIERAYRADPATTIGVLVRTNDPIATLRHELQMRGIPASEEGGNPLTDSVAVNTLLAAATLVDHSQDGPARYLLSHSPLADDFRLQPETDLTQPHNLQSAVLAAAHWRRQIAQWGLPHVLERWARQLAQTTTRREVTRLQQLLDIALANNLQWQDRPRSFVEYIEQQRVVDAAAARVRIMTVHAAKGLEFDVVIAPMLQQRAGWTSRPQEFVAFRSAPDRPFEMVSRNVASDCRAYLPDDLKLAFEQSERDAVEGELCVLYVMLTRAAHELTLIVPAKAKATQYGPVGTLLATLGSDSDSTPEGEIFLAGDIEWASQWRRLREQDNVNDESDLEDFSSFYHLDDSVKPAATAMGVGVQPEQATRIEPPSKQSILAKTRRLGDLFVDSEQRLARQQGDWLHACFQCLEWLEQPPTDARLKSQLKSQGVVGRAAALVIEQFRKTLRQSQVTQMFTLESARQRVMSHWFPASRPLLEPLRFVVQNERRYALLDANRELIEGIIDRLVLVYEGSRLVAAEILDLKTDRIPESAVDIRANYHRPQISAYRDAARQFLKLADRKQVRCWLVFSSCDRALEVA